MLSDFLLVLIIDMMDFELSCGLEYNEMRGCWEEEVRVTGVLLRAAYVDEYYSYGKMAASHYSHYRA